ncbi:MAG: hypothetical protein H7A01_00925 [Hahellaceae bacterium]|nr:hypothetical protein [Hahellaceae bacterium]MCP5210864.1 hypothetical protein [Hahellaceae bacterium]
MKTIRRTLMAAVISATAVSAQFSYADIIVGSDLNSTSGANGTINAIYSANRGTNGGGDQSLQFGDNLMGTYYDDVLVGGLGIDVLFGYEGDDVIVGGTEDFNAFNRDRAFGNQGNDTFIWTPGDGNDFFDGGEDEDVLIMALIGETRDDNGKTEGAPFFKVTAPPNVGSQDFDGIYIDPESQLPKVDVLAGPGFCEVLDSTTAGISELGLDHLVRFTLRGAANTFEATVADNPAVDQNSLDTGLRVAVHLRNTEFLVCASRDGSEIEVLDLRQSPPLKVTINDLPSKAYQLVKP